MIDALSPYFLGLLTVGYEKKKVGVLLTDGDGNTWVVYFNDDTLIKEG